MPIRGEHITSFARHYETHDTLTAIQKKFPDSNLYVIGISLGAAEVQRYLEEYGDRTPAKAACTIASPWDVSSAAIQLSQNVLCRNALVSEYKRKIKQHFHEENFVRIMKKHGFTEGKHQPYKIFRLILLEYCLSPTTNIEVDSFIATPDMGCNNVQEFYDLLNTHKLTHKITIPMLSINSRDDPICPYQNVPKDKITQNENIIHVETGGGAHVEFLSNLFPRMVSFSYSHLFDR